MNDVVEKSQGDLKKGKLYNQDLSFRPMAAVAKLTREFLSAILLRAAVTIFPLNVIAKAGGGKDGRQLRWSDSS